MGVLILLSCIYGVGSGGGRGRDCWKAERLTLGAVTPLFPLRSVVVIVIGFLSLPLLASSSSSPCWHGNVVVVVWPSCPIVRVSSDSWSLSLSFCRGCRHPWLWLSSSPCRHEIVVIVTRVAVALAMCFVVVLAWSCVSRRASGASPSCRHCRRCTGVDGGSSK